MAKKKRINPKNYLFPSLLLVSILIFVFSLFTSKAYAAVAVISPSNMQGWAFDVQSPDGFGTFVTGPASPPLGIGSARLFTGTNGNMAISLYNVSYLGINLGDITQLQYSTYSQSSGGSNSLYPIIVIDVSLNGFGPDFISFDPHDQTNQTPQLNVWQTWNAKDGIWRSSAFPQFSGTIQDYINALSPTYGDITIINRTDASGGIRVQTAETGTGDVHDENVDNFTIGINGGDITYDFEPTTATGTFDGSYYSDTTMTNPALAINDFGSHVLNLGSGMGSPGAGVPADNFSARVEGTFNFESAKYRFTVSTDNLMRVYVDDVLILNKTSRGADQAIYNGTAGVHTVRVEYIHATGNSIALMNFWKTSECRDMNADNKVTSIDLSIISQHFNQTGADLPWDLNNDNQITSIDLSQAAQKFGVACPYI